MMRISQPTLYSKTSTGAVQTWTITTDGNSFYTVSGQLNGKQTTSKPTVCVSKNVGKTNETSAAEQALLEAKAKFKKKLDSGYKLNIQDIDDVGFVEPMLAKDFKDRFEEVQDALDNNEKVFTQRKFDGMRAVINKKGMFSRNGKPIVSAPHIFEALVPMFKKYPDLILDGELYADKFADDFNSLMSLAKQVKPTEEDFKKSKESLEYHVYDIVDNNLIFEERLNKLADLYNEFDPNYVVPVETIMVKNIEQLDQLYGKFVEDGYEGQIIRLNKKYENKRSKYLLKRKEFVTDEFKVLDIIEGDGNRTGIAGYAILENEEGKTFKSNIKGNYDYCYDVLNNKQLFIGKLATVKYFHLTPGEGVPRFPYIIEFDRQDI